MKVSYADSHKKVVEPLQVLLKIRRGIMSHEWVKVQVLQFSSDGMVVRTDEELAIGGKSLFSIKLAMDFGDISIPKIEAVAQSREKVCSCFDYPVKFAFGNAKVGKDHLTKSVDKINALLSSYHSLVNKMKTGPFAAK